MLNKAGLRQCPSHMSIAVPLAVSDILQLISAVFEQFVLRVREMYGLYGSIDCNNYKTPHFLKHKFPVHAMFKHSCLCAFFEGGGGLFC